MQLGKKKKKLKPTYCSALSWMKPKCSAYRYQSGCWFTQHGHTPGRNFCWDFCLYRVAIGRSGWANVRQRQSETLSWAPYQLLLVNNQSSDSDWDCKIEPLTLDYSWYFDRSVLSSSLEWRSCQQSLEPQEWARRGKGEVRRELCVLEGELKSTLLNTEI